MATTYFYKKNKALFGGIKTICNVNKMAPADNSNVPKFSKWHLAIAVGIGTPVALGLAYWYFKKSKDSKKSNTFSEDIYDYSAQNAQNELQNKSSFKAEKSFVSQVCIHY